MGEKFLHKLSLERDGDGFIINGERWRSTSYSCWDWLSFNLDEATRVQIACEKGVFEWEYWKRLAEGVSFVARGKAASVEQCCAAARSFIPEIQVLDYLGQSHVWYGRTFDDGVTRWMAAIDGESAEVSGPYQHGTETPYFYTRRSWAPSEPILDLIGGSMGRRCPSLLEAFIMAVDLPARLKQACGALIAGLNHREG